MINKSIQNTAIKLRKQGYSYNMISEKIEVSKSTLCGWLKNIPFKPNILVLERIRLGSIRSATYKNAQKLSCMARQHALADKDVGTLSKRDLFMVGLGIYLGEGSKINETIRIVNSDPGILKMSIKWFKIACGLEDKNIIPTIHLYSDSDIKKSMSYWSKVISLPIEQFSKTQIDRRDNKSLMKKNKLPYGTIHLQIKSCGNKKLGRVLHRRIIGWIMALMKQI